MIQKIIFTQTMDSDSASEFLPDGRSRKRINVRVLSSDNSEVGAVETVKGNTLVDFTLPPGVNTVIGSKEDLLRKKLYYFVFNDINNHSILEYDEQANTVLPVFRHAMLNFKIDFLITGINIVELDADNHLLYWTDNYVDPTDPFIYNEPKKINIEKGILFMQGDFVNGYPFPFDSENLFRIKQPPTLLSPIAVYDDDVTIEINKLDKRLFQFKVQGIYDDKESTAWSPISKTAYPLNNEVVGKNNVIRLTIDTGIEIVKFLRIAVKEAQQTDFFLIAELDKDLLGISSNTTYVYDFFNDGLLLPLEINESIKLYDKVPKRSQSQEVIEGTRIADGLITEEFDPVEADLKIDYRFDFTELTYSIGLPIKITPFGGQTSPPVVVISPPDTPGVTATAIAIMEVESAQINNYGYLYTSPSYTLVGGGGSGAVLTGGASFGQLDAISVNPKGSGYTLPPIVLISDPNPFAGGGDVITYLDVLTIVITNPGSGYTTVPTVTLNGFSGSWTVELVPSKTVIPYESLKRGGSYIYGLIYYDHGNRSGLTNINEGRFDAIQGNGNYGTNLFIPFYTEPDPAGAATLEFDMLVDGIFINDPGSAYTVATTFTFSASGGGGTTATGDPVLGTGKILSLIVASVGAVYPADGTYLSVPLTGGSGTGAAANVTITGGLLDLFAIDSPGTGYLTGETLTLDPAFFVPPPGTPASFTINTDDGLITGITITNPGSGYTSFPTITVFDSGGGSGADIDSTMAIDTVSVVFGSSGYISAPTASFSNGEPIINATVTLGITSGVVDSVTLTDPGQAFRSLPTLLVEGRIYGNTYPLVNWEIYNQPPSWATHYQIARTKDGALTKYLQFVAGNILYLNALSNVNTFGNPAITQMAININNINSSTFALGSFAAANPGSILGYDFTKGDRIRFIKDADGDFYTDYWDFEIGRYAQAITTIIIQFPIDVYPGPPSKPMPHFTIGCLYEIYTPLPASNSVDKLTFEIGEGNEIALDGNGTPYHKGSTQDEEYWLFTDNAFLVSPGGFDLGFVSNVAHNLIVGDKIKVKQDSGFTWAAYNTYFVVTDVPSATSIAVNGMFLGNTPPEPGLITKPATGDFSKGDTFYRTRSMIPGVFGGTYLIEDSSYSDTTLLQSYDYGRPNRIDPQIAEITRPATIYYSQQLIPETNINGLSSVFASSFQTYTNSFGGIYKLYFEDLQLYLFQELKIGRVPVSQIIYNDLQLTNTVGASNVVLSPQEIYYAGEFGIGKHPESFAVYAKAKYGIDVRRGAEWRLSIDGLTPTSDTTFMHNYFNDKCKEILAYNGKVNIYGVYDIRFNEYICAFSNFADEGNNAETIAWNEKANAFSTFYTYYPENMCSNGIDIVSYKAGSIYTHNTNSIYGNFYGVQYQPELWCVMNGNPANVKILMAVAMETNAAWECYSITTPNGQESNLIETDFQEKENNQYASVLMDINTPNTPVVDGFETPLINGDVMRDRTFLLKFRYNGTDYNKLFSINLLYALSSRSNK